MNTKINRVILISSRPTHELYIVSGIYNRGCAWTGMLLVGSLLVQRVGHTITQLPFKNWLFGYQYGDIAMVPTIQMTHLCVGVSIHWTGLLDLTTGLDYWTDLFASKNHFYAL